MTSSTRFLAMAVMVATSLFSTTAEAGEPTLEWIQQLSTSEWDSSHGVSADGLGNVYISGYEGWDSNGGHSADAFVAKYSELETIPEPATLLLLIVGSMALCVLRNATDRGIQSIRKRERGI